jgi:hypothetical protein
MSSTHVTTLKTSRRSKKCPKPIERGFSERREAFRNLVCDIRGDASSSVLLSRFRQQAVAAEVELSVSHLAWIVVLNATRGLLDLSAIGNNDSYSSLLRY